MGTRRVRLNYGMHVGDLQVHRVVYFHDQKWWLHTACMNVPRWDEVLFLPEETDVTCLACLALAHEPA